MSHNSLRKTRYGERNEHFFGHPGAGEPELPWRKWIRENLPRGPEGFVFEDVDGVDARFRGHTDGATGDGELLELKSINDKGFERVAVSQRPKTEHALQVQTYLRYGPWTHALVVYVNRATFEHLVLCVAENTRVGLDMEQKAKRVLAAIDARQAPRCECNYCER